jgi:protein phosphatase
LGLVSAFNLLEIETMSDITIQCANCQTANPLEASRCEKCDTPLVKRYLWSVGDWIKVYQVGEFLEERYLLKYPQILLDTKPGNLPNSPDDLPGDILPYLKLFPYSIHIPQIYSYFPSPDDQINLEVWLLDYGSLPLNEAGDLLYGEEFLPKLTDLWPSASPLRQLHWLWQMARLWQPLATKGVVSSLLDPSLLRINGYTLKILELRKDPIQVPTFKQLGKIWSQWLDGANPNVAEFIKSLCQGLEQGKIKKYDQLIQLLDQGLQQCGQYYQRDYQIFTATDTGPTRDHNEDARYPVTETHLEAKEAQEALVIVCDGIGGQEGGEIASQLAIDTLVEQLSKVILTASPKKGNHHVQAIDQAIRETNNRISQRNDRENRQERQRMGTTLVMGVTHHHEIYLAHVGDSRIYWITPESCHQITTDDDLASREVRLGYLLHRDATQYPNAGALIQALGMSDATALHPNVQRWILDEDCLFLLCSDGLSDYDRVDQYWRTEITLLLRGETSIEALGQKLIELSNEKNGHDNVTIGLIYCQVKAMESLEPLEALNFEVIDPVTPSAGDNATSAEVSTTDSDSQVTVAPPELTPSTENSEVSSPKSSSLNPLLIVGGIILAGLAAAALWLVLRPSESTPPINNTPSPTSSPTESVP